MKPRRIVFLMLAAALVALAVFIWPETEPRYQGTRLTQWVIACKAPTPSPVISPRLIGMNGGYPGTTLPGGFTSKSQGASPEEALRQIGTNGLPYLVKWIRYETPWWKTKLGRGFDYLPEKLRPRFLNSELKLERANSCPVAFAILGQQAAGAVPELCGLLDKPTAFTNPSPAFQRARLAFQMLGTNALPEVLQLLTNRANSHRLGAAIALDVMPPSKKTAAVLIACLQDPDSQINQVGARSLGNIHLADVDHPDQAILAFTNGLQGSSSWVREQSALALGRLGMYRHGFDPGWDKLPLPALTNALTDLNLAVREAATNAIKWWTDPDGTNFTATSFTCFGPSSIFIAPGTVFRPTMLATPSNTFRFRAPASTVTNTLRARTFP